MPHTLARSKYPPPLFFSGTSPKLVKDPHNDLPASDSSLNMFERSADAYSLEYPTHRVTSLQDSIRQQDNAGDTAAVARRVGSDSPPGPIEIHTSSSTFPHPLSAPHSQGHFSNSNNHHAFGAEMDRYNNNNNNNNSALPDRYIRNNNGIDQLGPDKYPPFPSHSLLDQRRMSEPSIFGSSGSAHPSAYPNPGAEPSTGRYQQMQFAFNPPPPSPRSPYLHRGTSSGSLRDHHLHHISWKGSNDMQLHPFGSGVSLDEPISPLNPNFSGGAHSPTLGMASAAYPSIAEDPYGPSPPGTGTSTTSSNAPPNRNIGTANSGSSSSSKTYSFVSLPGNAVKKRPRRRYDEIERLYQCSWPDCNKAYGTLNHLNAHVTMQKHGTKRSPNEFKELRKQWRKAKKEEEANRAHSAHMHHSSRRADMIDSDLHMYPRHRSSSHHHHHHPYHHGSAGLHSSIAVSGLDARYSAIDDMRYPIDELDGMPRGHGAEDAFRRNSHSHPDLQIRAHSRYRSSSGPGPWHPGMPSSRPANHYLASTGLPANADISLNRLGPDSTLLTPLPGYEAHSLVPIDGGLNGYGGYGSGGGGYDDDGRPDTGHRSLYDDGRPDTGHRSLYDDGRPDTGHRSLYDDSRPNTGHGSAYDDSRPNTGHGSLYGDDRPGTGHGREREGEFRHL